jgi:hypothetical protein
MKRISFFHRGTKFYAPGLLGGASMGIKSLARVARRAANDLSRVDMELPASSVSCPKNIYVYILKKHAFFKSETLT